jgi:hypothetical protein
LQAAKPQTDVEVRIAQGTYASVPMDDWHTYVPSQHGTAGPLPLSTVVDLSWVIHPGVEGATTGRSRLLMNSVARSAGLIYLGMDTSNDKIAVPFPGIADLSGPRIQA